MPCSCSSVLTQLQRELWRCAPIDLMVRLGIPGTAADQRLEGRCSMR